MIEHPESILNSWGERQTTRIRVREITLSMRLVCCHSFKVDQCRSFSTDQVVGAGAKGLVLIY